MRRIGMVQLEEPCFPFWTKAASTKIYRSRSTFVGQHSISCFMGTTRNAAPCLWWKWANCLSVPVEAEFLNEPKVPFYKKASKYEKSSVASLTPLITGLSNHLHPFHVDNGLTLSFNIIISLDWRHVRLIFPQRRVFPFKSRWWLGLNLEHAPKKTTVWSHWQRLLHWEPLPEKEKTWIRNKLVDSLWKGSREKEQHRLKVF